MTAPHISSPTMNCSPSMARIMFSQQRDARPFLSRTIHLPPFLFATSCWGKTIWVNSEWWSNSDGDSQHFGYNVNIIFDFEHEVLKSLSYLFRVMYWCMSPFPVVKPFYSCTIQIEKIEVQIIITEEVTLIVATYFPHGFDAIFEDVYIWVWIEVSWPH